MECGQSTQKAGSNLDMHHDDQEALASFRKVGQWSNDEQRMANKIFQYVFRLVANRAISLSQHSKPPLRYMRVCWMTVSIMVTF